jgi:hypothetical protein
MVRILGILCGSALAISSLIIALGMPEFLPGPVEAPAVIAEAEEIEIAPEPETVTVVEASVEDLPVPLPEPLPEPFPEPLPEPSTEHWYAFWSPFRSELAANGFVSQLQRSTGIDYRVVQLKPGVYEVAFAYEADADIASRLAAISAATGLDLPDG